MQAPEDSSCRGGVSAPEGSGLGCVPGSEDLSCHDGGEQDPEGVSELRSVALFLLKLGKLKIDIIKVNRILFLHLLKNGGMRKLMIG